MEPISPACHISSHGSKYLIYFSSQKECVSLMIPIRFISFSFLDFQFLADELFDVSLCGLHAKDTGIDAQVVRRSVAPLLVGIIVVIRRAHAVAVTQYFSGL